MATIKVQTNYNTPIWCGYYNNDRYPPPYDLANCTAYAAGRASFLLYGQDEGVITPSNLMPVHPNIIGVCGNGYSFGSSALALYPEFCSNNPTLGALISYQNGGAGHVAVVEGIVDADTIIISSSGYSKHNAPIQQWVWNETLHRSNGWRSTWMSSAYKFITFYDPFHGNNPYTSYNIDGTPQEAPDTGGQGALDDGFYAQYIRAAKKTYARNKKRKIYPNLNYIMED